MASPVSSLRCGNSSSVLSIRPHILFVQNDLIVSGSNDCKIKIWDAWTGECLRTLAGHNGLVRAISFDPKTGRLLSASYDKVIKVWDIYDGAFSGSTSRSSSDVNVNHS